VEYLYAPWRAPYVGRAAKRPAAGCLFCRLARSHSDRRQRILHRGAHCLVVLNAFPYCSGHLMIAPLRHRAGLAQLAAAEAHELIELAAEAERALLRAYRADGLNLGINLGRAAGAGVPGHVHLHALPRWVGDTNFMSAVSTTRVVPESLSETYRRLRPLFRARRARR
jgi:ATP adenylyltransferase